MSNNHNIVLISEKYFEKYNSKFIEMLDVANIKKQSNRMYLFLKIKIDENNILIPLRTNLPKLGNAVVGYHVPSKSKPNAGFDYRKMLIVDDEYIIPVENLNIPNSQQKIILEKYEVIETQVKKYIKNYKKAVEKNRQFKDRIFKFSTLHNFHKELNLERKNDMNTVMIVAAGSGKRMNAGMNKQFIEINGKEIVAHTIERFNNSSLIDEIVLCIKEEEEDFVRENIIEKYGFKDIVISYGGKERQDTINNGLEKVSPNCDILLIHDGARPFVTDEIIENAVNETKKLKATVVGVMVKDTIKVVDGNEIVDTPNRANLWAAQTPQSFDFNLIKDAYELAYRDGFYGTDDAMIAEHAGHKVYMIQGSYDNIKITSPEDLAISEVISRGINS